MEIEKPSGFSTALVVALVIGLPLGIALGRARFPGHSALVSLVNAGMGAPPVVAGTLAQGQMPAKNPSRVLCWPRGDHLTGSGKEGKWMKDGC